MSVLPLFIHIFLFTLVLSYIFSSSFSLIHCFFFFSLFRFIYFIYMKIELGKISVTSGIHIIFLFFFAHFIPHPLYLTHSLFSILSSKVFFFFYFFLLCFPTHCSHDYIIRISLTLIIFTTYLRRARVTGIQRK